MRKPFAVSVAVLGTLAGGTSALLLSGGTPASAATAKPRSTGEIGVFSGALT
jgi:hypothetical protein